MRFREHAVRSCSISLVHNGRMSNDMKPPVLFTKRCVRTRCTVISLFPFQNCDKIKLTAMEDRSYPNNFFVFRLTFQTAVAVQVTYSVLKLSGGQDFLLQHCQKRQHYKAISATSLLVSMLIPIAICYTWIGNRTIRISWKIAFGIDLY